jgi:HK97 family phage portal protein
MGLLFSRKREATPTDVKKSLVSVADYRENVVAVNTPDKALKIAAVYRAVNLISNGLAILPMHYKRWNSALRYFVMDETPAGQRINYMIGTQPNDRMDAFHFWKQVVCQILLLGNAYIVPERNTYGEPERLILCTPGTVLYDVFMNNYYITDTYNGIYGYYSSRDVIHLKNMSFDGYIGVSTICFAARTMGIAATGDEETLKRFATGGRFKAILSNNNTVQGFGKYQDKQLEGAAEDLNAALRSGQDIISLPGDVKPTPISMSSSDMQFLDSRKFTIREIARIFNVPAAKLMDDSNTVYGTAEANNLAFYSEALQPIIADIEAEFRAKLLGPDQYRNRKYCFDIANLFALDRKSQAEWMKSRLETGVASVNDLRREMDAPPTEDGDDVFVSVNLAPLGSEKLNGKPSNPE